MTNAPSDLAATTGDPHIVLAIDDVQANLDLLRGCLDGPDLVLESYTRAEPALDACRDRNVDLILLDLHMPGLDGFGFLERVRPLLENRGVVPIVVLTGDVSTDTRQRALSLGATEFLTKPLDVIDVRLRVANLLRLRDASVRLERQRDLLEEEVARRTRDLEIANERLSDMATSKDAFIASVSHALRTPLTAVLGFARELASESVSGDERLDLSRLVAEQATELAGIVDNLLVTARAHVDSLSIQARPVDLANEVEAVVKTLSETDRNRVEISGRASALADPARLRQILRNLITNALRHGGPHTWVDVRAQEGRSAVLVADDGAGIHPARHDRLFEPFQMDGKVKGSPQPLGIGLSVSHYLAGRMNGHLVYRHGDRSIFELSLPSGEVHQPVETGFLQSRGRMGIDSR